MFLMALCNKGIAQWQTNGNSISSGDFVGTTNAQPLELKTNTSGVGGAQSINFYTNLVQQMILNSGGSLGLGNTSPASILHIDGSGTSSTSGEVFRTNAPNTTATYWRMFRNVSGTPTEFGTISNPGNDNHFYIEATQGSGDLRFQSGGANTRMTITSSGNVGIGTQTPSNLLHVYNSGTGGASYTQLSNGNVTYTNGLLVGINTSNEGVINMQDNKPLKFYTNNTQYMHISNTGDIAIGTSFSSPSGRLHQFVSGANNNFHYFETGTGGSGFKKFRIGMTSTNTVELNIDQNWPMNFFTNNTQRMTILGDGKVGIGTTSPSVILGLDGNSAQTFGLERHSTSNTAGNNFTVRSGGATSAATNQNGGNLILSGGTSTGTGTSAVQLYTSAAGSSGTSDNTPAARVTVTGGGKVGIGNTSPSTALHIDGTNATLNTGDVFRTDAPSGATYWKMFMNYSEVGRIWNNNDTHFYIQATTDDLRLQSGGANTRMTIASGGNVGVGTTSPSARFHIQSGSTSNGNFGFRVDDSNSNDIVQVRDGGTVLMGNGLGNTAGGLGLGVNFGSTVGARLEIHGAAGSNGRCIEVDNTAASSGIFYVLDNTRVGIGTVPTHTLELYDDDAWKTSTSDWIIPSDIRLKTDTSLFTDGLNIVRQVHPVNYKFKPETGLDPVTNNIGVISQEIQQIAPYVIRDTWMKLDTNDVDSTQIHGVNMHAFWFILINAIKELDANNQALIARIDELESGSSGSNPYRHANPDNEEKHSTNVQLSNVRTIILDQNVPNPFAEQTTINYFLPDDVSKAQIIFYNNNGTVLKIVDLNEKGRGELNVFAADLSSGIYTYTLIADGKVIETKKMVKQ